MPTKPNIPHKNDGDLFTNDDSNTIVDFFAQKTDQLDFLNSAYKVKHGANPSIARPMGHQLIIWIGSIEPIYAIDDDLWIDTTI